MESTGRMGVRRFNDDVNDNDNLNENENDNVNENDNDNDGDNVNDDVNDDDNVNDDDGDDDNDSDDDSGLVLASSQLSLLSATPETASPVTQSIGFQPKQQSIIRNLL